MVGTGTVVGTCVVDGIFVVVSNCVVVEGTWVDVDGVDVMDCVLVGGSGVVVVVDGTGSHEYGASP